jgi:hypothetical protein
LGPEYADHLHEGARRIHMASEHKVEADIQIDSIHTEAASE